MTAFFVSDTSFVYDSAGNRQLVADDASTGYVTNSLNQYESAQWIDCTYDAKGNLTGDGTNTYTYDAENRLTGVTNLSTTYTYDATGRRIEKNINGSVTTYVYDGDQVICEFDASDRLIRKFLYGTGIDEPIRMTAVRPPADISGNGIPNEFDLGIMAWAWLAQSGELYFIKQTDLNFDGKIDNADSDILSANWLLNSAPSPISPTEQYYFHYDGLGSVVALSDSSGQTVETYAYDVFGRNLIRSTSPLGNPYLFTGRRFDNETKLYYYRARYYSPYLGRFLQPDPIGYSDGTNMYIYCGNNPIILIDPFGLCSDVPGTLGESTLLWLKWLTGFGSSYDSYGPETAFAEVMRTAEGVEEARYIFNDKFADSDIAYMRYEYSRDRDYTFKVWEYFFDGKQPVEKFLGSYSVSIGKNKGKLSISVQNESSMGSILYDPGLSYERNIGFAIPGVTYRTKPIPHPGGTIRQRIYWTETVAP